VRQAAWRRKPLRRDLARVDDGRCRTDARTLCPKAEQETVDDILADPRRSRVPGGKLAELGEPTNVNLGRSALVAKVGEMRRNAVHLIAKCAIAKPPEHFGIREIEIQHEPLSRRRVREILSRKEEGDIMCRRNPRTLRNQRLLDRAATYSRPTH